MHPSDFILHAKAVERFDPPDSQIQQSAAAARVMTIIGKHHARAALTACFLLGISTIASAQTAPRDSQSSVTEEQAARNAAGRAAAARQLNSLKDPRQRPKHLQHFKMQADEFQPELAETLELDANTAEKLLQLLAEQRIAAGMGMLERSSTALDASDDTFDDDSSAIAANLDRERAELKALLGSTGFQRYLRYLSTAIGRRHMLAIDVPLARLHLSRAQKEQLVALYAQQARARERKRHPTAIPTRESFEPLLYADRASRQHYLLLSSLRLSEDRLATETQLQAQLLQGSSKFLSTAQQAPVQGVFAPYLERLEQTVRALRQQAGLDPDQPLDSVHPRPKQPQPLQRDLHWTLQLCGNTRTPQRVSFYGLSGQHITFQTSDGLLVDATVRAYDNGRIHALLELFEQDDTGYYQIGALDAVGPLQPVAVMDDHRNDVMAPECPGNSNSIVNSVGFSSDRGVVIAGSKSYRLTLAVSGTLQ